MINVLVSGCCGEMGKNICKLIEKESDMQVVYGFDKTIQTTNDFISITETGSIPNDKKPDVIIDFSAPAATEVILEYAYNANVPIVIATTGLSHEIIANIDDYSKHIPVFNSANMSYEIPFLKKILQQMAPQLASQGYDIEILEAHHNRKADAPSGTAKLLADAINESLEVPKEIIYGREGKRKSTEIGISAIRGGNVVGEHSVMFFGPNEKIELKHTAYSRAVFAEGAIKAAKFIVKQKPGLYNMDDLM